MELQSLNKFNEEAMKRQKGYGKTRCSFKYREWKEKVHKRDDYKCVKCKSDKYLHAHHIKSWKENESYRFDVDNGLTLCASCHMSHEGQLRTPWNKGTKGLQVAWNKGVSPPEEVKKKISDTLKVNPVNYWKGKKRSEEDKKKMSMAKIGKSAIWNSKPKSEETKRKISETKKGSIPWNKGLKYASKQ